MNSCRSIFSISQLTPEIKAFNNFLLYCKDFFAKHQDEILPESEPTNGPVTEPPQTSLHIKRYSLPSITPSCISHGLKLLGISTFSQTVSAQCEPLTFNEGVPAGERTQCSTVFNIKCVEVYLTEGKDVIARFVMAANQLYANKGTEAANYVSECLASTADPLIQILKDMVNRFPQWQNPNGTYYCPQLIGFEDLNTKVTGVGYATHPLFDAEACDSFKKNVMRKAERCVNDYVMFGGSINVVNVALIATALLALTVCGAVSLNRYTACRRQAEEVRNAGLQEALRP